MQKFNSIKTVIACTVIVFESCSSVLALCPSGQAEDATTGHCIISGSDCSGKCKYYYDTTTHDIVIKPNEGATGDIVTNRGYGSVIPIHNMTLEEGITGIANVDNQRINGQGEDTGTLILPSTITSIPSMAIFNGRFATVDASAMKNASTVILGIPTLKTLIISDDTSVVSIGSSYGHYPSDVAVLCKGNVATCQSRIATPSYVGSYSSYVGLNDDGNWEVWSDDGVAIYADSTLQKPLGKYDFEGNQTGVYKYDGAGNLTAAYENGVSTYKRTSYTPAEAAAAIKKGNNNKITFTFK